VLRRKPAVTELFHRVFGAVKTEFGKFGDMLDKVKKKLDETGNTIEDAVHPTRQIEKKLRNVEALPVDQGVAVLNEVQVSDVENEEPDQT
jgi:DNA recombination protein RmuC